MAVQEEIDLRRLYWAGPVTVAAAVVEMASNPLRTFRRMSAVVMLVSCAPNLKAAFSRDAGVEWGMLALMVMHVVAWAVTVPMLTRLTVVVAQPHHTETS